jgi:hypothetical protein
MLIETSKPGRARVRGGVRRLFLVVFCMALGAIPAAGRAAGTSPSTVPVVASGPLSLPPTPSASQPHPVGLISTAPVSGTWQPIDDVPPTLGRIEDLLVAPDGDLYLSGGMLELDGRLLSGLFRRHAGAWTQIAAYVDPTTIKALAWGHDSLYVAGRFSSIGGVPADLLARWDGQQWSAVGSGFTGIADAAPWINDLAFDQGILYISGWFNSFNGVEAKNLARWDGTTASAFGDFYSVWSVDADNGKVYVQGSDFAGWDGSQWFSMAAGWSGQWSGSGLASGGRVFGRAGSNVLEWTGSQWELVGAAPLATDGKVSDLALIGNVLYAGLTYPTPAAQSSTDYALRRWDGTEWQQFAPDLGGVTALAAGPDGLYLGAVARRLNTLDSALWRWDGAAAHSLDLRLEAMPKVSRLAAAADGAAYAQLTYDVTASHTATSLLRWQAGAWSDAWPSFTPPFPGASLGPIDIGQDGRLYAITQLSNYRHSVIRYDDGAWITMTDQLVPANEVAHYGLSALHVISPTAIYALGDYMAYGPPERAVTAFWNGTAWSASLFSHAPYEENVHSGQQCGDKYYMLMTPIHWSMSMRPTEIYEVDLDTGQYTLISGYDLDISKVKVLACRSRWATRPKASRSTMRAWFAGTARPLR